MERVWFQEGRACVTSQWCSSLSSAGVRTSCARLCSLEKCFWQKNMLLARLSQDINICCAGFMLPWLTFHLASLSFCSHVGLDSRTSLLQFCPTHPVGLSVCAGVSQDSCDKGRSNSTDPLPWLLPSHCDHWSLWFSVWGFLQNKLLILS